MDRFQHFLWRYSDEEDITHPKNNRFKDSIHDFYIKFDEMIGDILTNLGQKEGLAIISDHGHGRRCTRVLNINEVLRKKGYYRVETQKIKILDKKYLLERLKNSGMDFIYRFNLEDMMYLLAKFIPKI